MRREWDRWGCWLKARRPRPRLEEVGSEHVTEYLGCHAKFRAKSTQYGMMSRMRQIGDLSDSDEATGTILVYGQKSRRERRVPLPDLCRQCLEA